MWFGLKWAIEKQKRESFSTQHSKYERLRLSAIMPSILEELLAARKSTRKLIPQQSDDFMKNIQYINAILCAEKASTDWNLMLKKTTMITQLWDILALMQNTSITKCFLKTRRIWVHPEVPKVPLILVSTLKCNCFSYWKLAWTLQFFSRFEIKIEKKYSNWQCFENPKNLF